MAERERALHLPCRLLLRQFTNLFFLALSIWGMHKTYQQDMPKRFIFAFLGMAGVSIGSFAFHATLKYEAQLLDELPMIYTMAFFLYCVLETTPGYGKPKYAVLLPASLFAFVAFVTVAYLINRNPVFHQVAYALMQVISTVQVFRLMRSKTLRLTSKQRKEMSNVFIVGTVMFLSAFGIWNIDNIYCGRLRAARRAIGFPWEVLLEGHGWWHLGTGLGGYLVIVAAQRLMLSVKEENGDNFAFSWSVGGLVPHVQRVKAYKKTRKTANGAGANGHAKKPRASGKKTA